MTILIQTNAIHRKFHDVKFMRTISNEWRALCTHTPTHSDCNYTIRGKHISWLNVNRVFTPELNWNVREMVHWNFLIESLNSYDSFNNLNSDFFHLVPMKWETVQWKCWCKRKQFGIHRLFRLIFLFLILEVLVLRSFCSHVPSSLAYYEYSSKSTHTQTQQSI